MDSKMQIKVGIFVSLGLASVLTLIMVLGGDRALFTQYSEMYANFDQVQGLNKGSVVSLAGINIGNVRTIEFSESDKALRVIMKIDSQFMPRIKEGSLAEVRTQGALGDKFVYIVPGPSAAPTLPPQSTLETAKASDILGVLSEKGKDAEKIFTIINELTKLTKTINHDNRSEKIMANLADTSVHLKSTITELNQLVKELRGNNPKKINESLDKLTSILGKVDRGEGTLGALVNDSALHEQLKSLLGVSSRRNSLKSLIKSTVD
jgi:phospholipid/cholesterol/gamma-HCH transport system substrate-binding protein